MGSEKQPDDLLDTAHDPMRIVGPGEAQAPPQDCEFKPGQLDGSPSESQFKAKEELQEGFSIEPTPMILSPVDGMPLPTDETAFEFAPTQTFENFVCGGDDRKYVELFHEERGDEPGSPPTDVVRRSQYMPKGEDRERWLFDRSRVVRRFGKDWVELDASEVQLLRQETDAYGRPMRPADGTAGPFFFEVRPIRPVCKHYKRQLFNNDSQPNPQEFGHKIKFALCNARRSVGGAHMSIRDEAVYACDFRDPPDPRSTEEHLDAVERKRLETVVEMVPMFNLP